MSAGASIVVAVAPVRREPEHASECVTQGLHGEPVRVLEKSPDGAWLRVRLATDGYEGWLRSWYVGERASSAALPASGWVKPRSLRVRALPKRGAAVLAELPWPARLALAGEERGWAAVRLEDGRDGFVPSREVAGGLAPGGDPTGARIAKTARALVGAPYLWGGRSAWGFDCSGFVQAVFAWHGLSLPRDSQEQWRRGRGQARSARTRKASPGDLLFFGSEERVTHVALATGSDAFLHAYGEVCPGSLNQDSQVYVPELVGPFLGIVKWGLYRPSPESEIQ